MVVTYPDGTTDEVPVTVHVNSQADQNDPKGQDIDVNKGETPNPADGISNKGDLPDGTTYTCKDGQTPDTTTPGNKDATVVVTYPDGSTDEVPVTVHVTDPTNPSTDADKNTPQPQPITVKEGETPNAEDGIANKGDLPDGTKYEWKDGKTSDTSKPGDTSGMVVVTYPDGSKDEVTVPVHVPSQADENEPKTQPINTDKGKVSNPADGISNKGDLPDGTKYEWRDGQAPDTTTPGDTSGTVVVTYPEGSKDEVTVPVHVNSDADNNEPSGQTTITTATTNGNGGNTTQAATGAKQAPAKTLPQTGNEDTTNMSVLGLTFANLFGALVALGLRKKKEDK